MTEFLYGVDKPFTLYFDGLAGKIFEHYSGPGICSSQLAGYSRCAFSNLTYSQWLDNAVLNYPLNSAKDGSSGYVMRYSPYSSGWITPEYGFWRSMNEIDPLSDTDFAPAMADTYFAMSVN